MHIYMVHAKIAAVNFIQKPGGLLKSTLVRSLLVLVQVVLNALIKVDESLAPVQCCDMRVSCKSDLMSLYAYIHILDFRAHARFINIPFLLLVLLFPFCLLSSNVP